MQAIIGIGIPGIGKTTYLKPLAKRLGYGYVNADDIRQEVNGDARDHSRHSYIMQLFHERITKSLSQGGVVVDATYSRCKDRRQVMELCRNNGARNVVAYWFTGPVSRAVNRNLSRERQVPEAAIYSMHNRLRLNPPTLSEGFDEVITI